MSTVENHDIKYPGQCKLHIQDFFKFLMLCVGRCLLTYVWSFHNATPVMDSFNET